MLGSVCVVVPLSCPLPPGQLSHGRLACFPISLALSRASPPRADDGLCAVVPLVTRCLSYTCQTLSLFSHFFKTTTPVQSPLPHWHSLCARHEGSPESTMDLSRVCQQKIPPPHANTTSSALCVQIHHAYSYLPECSKEAPEGRA